LASAARTLHNSAMKTRRGNFSHGRQYVFNRISNRLIQDARASHRQDFKLLAAREVTAVLNDVRREIERRRAVRTPAHVESLAAA